MSDTTETVAAEIPENVKKAVGTIAASGVMTMMMSAIQLLRARNVPEPTLLAKSAEMTAELQRQFTTTFRATMERVIDMHKQGLPPPDPKTFSNEFKEAMAEAGRSCARRVFGFEAQA